jgi:hypothetical protein
MAISLYQAKMPIISNEQIYLTITFILIFSVSSIPGRRNIPCGQVMARVRSIIEFHEREVTTWKVSNVI